MRFFFEQVHIDLAPEGIRLILWLLMLNWPRNRYWVSSDPKPASWRSRAVSMPLDTQAVLMAASLMEKQSHMLPGRKCCGRL